MAKGYRPDIDGLRAIAVTAVLAFHAFPASLPGGFTGVDIFFVISGFLISGIILGELQAGTFTFANFYARRIRRIFPALALVLIAATLFGWYTLSPYDFEQLGGHVAAGAGFVANIQLWRESGYFDTDSALKPLLHLWSLGVEEQYYFVWPLLLFVFKRHIPRIFWLILGIALGSFLLNIVSVHRFASAAFYLPMMRFWELMLGSIVAYLQVVQLNGTAASGPGIGGTTAAGRASFGGGAIASLQAAIRSLPNQPLWANLCSIAGALLLGTTLSIVHDGRGFPGWWAVLPTLGAALLIVAGPAAWINRHILSSRPFVFIGLISYPLYLWHWPLLSFARIVINDTPTVGVRLACLAVSAVLAWVTYQCVEKPIRRISRIEKAPRTVGWPAALVGAAGVYGLLVIADVAQARSDAVPHLAEISAAYSDWHYSGDRVIEGDSPETVLFFGDSHMQQFLPRIEELMDEDGVRKRTVVFRTRAGCAPVPGIERPGYGCDKFVDSTFEFASRPEVKTVIISASWAGFVDRTDYHRAGHEDDEKALQMTGPGSEWMMQGFESAVARLTHSGKQVVIVLSSPFGKEFDPHEMAQRDGFGFRVNVGAGYVPRNIMDADSGEIDDWLAAMAARVHATVIDPLDTICQIQSCPVVDSQGAPVMKDDSHLRSSFVIAHFDAFDRYVVLGAGGSTGTIHASSAQSPADSAIAGP